MRERTHQEESVESHTAPEARCGSATVEPVALALPASVDAGPAKPPPDLSLPPRLRTADRQQLLSPMTIDDLLEADHPARAVWRFALGLDLTVLYDRILARGHSAGRPAIDPRILVALWLYATLAGVKSANALADLCIRHDAYFWLAGGIAVNAHTLSDFRVQDSDFLEQMLQHSVTVLRQPGVIDLERVAQDGMRVRASAGAASFRRRETLEKLLQEAQAEVQRLQQQPDATAEPTVGQEVATQRQPAQEQDEPSRQQRAAARRHAAQRVERIRRALGRMPEMEAKKEKARKKKSRKKGGQKAEKNEAARVSATDPEATVMKMPDGGYRPAYNVQFSTVCQGQVIVGVEVVTEGTDQGQLPPMLDQIEKRFEERPKEALVDGGFANHEDIEKVQKGEKGCKVYAPVPEPKKKGVDRYEPKATDSEEVAKWRERMGKEEAKEIYKERAATAECVNAQARNRGLTQFLVRGLRKVKAIALWFAIAHNVARGFTLQPQPLPTG
jgi:transposase